MNLSVVTPSFNQGEFIERTLDSVLSQDHPDFEYIVMDAMSTDATAEVLARCRERIDQLIVERDSGQADSLRKGFENATGDIHCYLNSDDVLLPGTLKFVTDYLKANPDVDAIYSNRIFLDDRDKITGFWILPPHSSYFMSRWDFIPQETCFWRRSLMERAGSIDPTFNFALDYDLFVRMMKIGRFKHINKFLSGFRVHPGAKSSNFYETVGRKEIAQVQKAQGVKVHWYDFFLKYLFGGLILGVSWLYKVFAIRGARRNVRFR